MARSIVLVLAASLLLAAAPALAQARQATPELIQRSEDAGRLDRSRADLFRAYAIAAPEHLPLTFRSDAPWDGTLTLLQVRRDLPRLREAERNEIQALLAVSAASPSCDSASSNQASVADTTHFHVTYDGVDAGLSVAQYSTSLEQAWQTEVESFGWAAPPVYTPNPAPGNRYHVRIDDLAAGLYGFVSPVGAHAGLVGDNPATAWDEGDAYASCMVLNRDYSGFPSTPQDALDSTTAHEFNHSIQFGYGGLSGTNLPDDVFIEGGATWMEDEVQDAADDNYNYLWPVFRDSMGDYDNSPYPYWITFRGLTERYGTGTPGGGEQVMQDFWELTSRNAESNQDAIGAALDARGTTLADAFHAYAVAIKFNRPCGGSDVYPYCLEEGPGYESAAGSPPVDRTIASVGGSTTFSVEDNYALAWVALPASSGQYNVTLNNTSSAGQLRATVACETASELRLSPLPAAVASGGSSTLVGFNPVGCTARVLVVTNQSQTAANPNNSNVRSFSVTTAAAPASTHTLSVTRTGSGSGTVTSSPPGIDCGADCSQSYAANTSVMLTATAATGSGFAGWSGTTGCSGTGPCTVTMDSSRSVKAAFELLADVTAPQTTISGGPAGQTSDSTPTFSFTSSEGGSTFTCQIDDGGPFACASPYTTGLLADGAHTFSVYATDTHGNQDLTPAIRSFTVAGGAREDTDPPETTITSGPTGTTNDNTPAFTFSSDEADSTFVCQLDQGLALPCNSPHTTEPLGAGQHVFSVYARDSAGNPDPTPATRAFTLAGSTDLVAPAISRLRLSPTKFRAARSGAALSAVTGTRVSLTLSEAATVTFRVSRLLPGRRVGGRCVRATAGNRVAPPCTRGVRLRGRIVRGLAAGASRLRYRGRLAGRRLRPGRYRLLVRARDTAGNRSTTERANFVILR